jgi:membrane protein DedA with SNARE-associated domain
MGIVEGLIERVADLGDWRIYALGALLAFAETMFLLDLIVPGEIGMVLVGAATDEADLSLPIAIACAAVGASIGDTVGYAIGRRWGLDVVDRWELTRRRIRPKLDAAHERFEQRGGAVVFGGRWVGALRAVVPVVVGAAGMPFGRFLAWNALASATWATTVVSLGYVFGRHIGGTVERVGLAISIVVVGVLVVRWWRKRRAAPATANAAADANR